MAQYILEKIPPSGLLDQLGPEGQVGEKKKSSSKIFFDPNYFLPVFMANFCTQKTGEVFKQNLHVVTDTRGFWALNKKHYMQEKLTIERWSQKLDMQASFGLRIRQSLLTI